MLYATSLVLLGAKAKFLHRKSKVSVALDEISEICWPNPCFLWLLYQDILRTERFPKILMQSVVMNDLFVWVMPSHSHKVTFGNIELGLPEPKPVKIFLRNKTVLQWMNVPIQDSIVRVELHLSKYFIINWELLPLTVVELHLWIYFDKLRVASPNCMMEKELLALPFCWMALMNILIINSELLPLTASLIKSCYIYLFVVLHLWIYYIIN